MDWHVFLAVNVFFCASVFIYHADASTNLRNTSPKFSIIDREKRDAQGDDAVINTQGNFQISGINLPNIASHIRKGLHNVLQSLANPISAEVIAEFGRGQGNYGNNQQFDNTNYDNTQGYQNGISIPNYGNGPFERPPPPSFPHHDGPPHPPYGHHMPPYGYHMPPHGHHRPPHGHHRPPPPPPFDQNPPPPPNGNGQYNENYNPREGRPDFFSQPNYPRGQINIDLSNQHGFDKDENEGTTSASTPYIFSDGPSEVPLNLDPHNSKTQEKSNVSGYIENNFPVILLKENEIR